VNLAGALAADWAPTVARILLGLVLLWFGYHELVLPGEWTGYVPVISESSSLAIILVLAHGWVLLVLAAALTKRIPPSRSAAADLCGGVLDWTRMAGGSGPGWGVMGWSGVLGFRRPARRR